MASDQFRQLSLLRRCHKAKADLQCTDEAQKRPKRTSAKTKCFKMFYHIYYIANTESWFNGAHSSATELKSVEFFLT